MQTITKREHAIEDAIKELARMGYICHKIIPYNNARYFILHTDIHLNILLIYKTRWYETYKKSEFGESVNREDLKVANSKECRIIARTDGKNLLFANLFDFVLSGRKRVNKEGKEIVSNSMHLFKEYSNYQRLEKEILVKQDLERFTNERVE